MITSLEQVKSLKANMKDNMDYFISFCLQTEDCNPMGHSMIMVSQLDKSQGQQARFEIISAIGFYSERFPVLGFKPIAQGKIKAEDAKYIAGKGGLYHKTTQVTFKEVDKLLTSVFEKKTRLDHHAKQKHSNCKCENLPTFNLFKQRNCKQFMLKELSEIDLKIDNLSSTIEVPRLAHLHPCRVEKIADAYYWQGFLHYDFKSDLPKINQDCHLQRLQQAAAEFDVALDKALLVINQRVQKSLRRAKQSTELVQLKRELTKVKQDLATYQRFPYQLTADILQNLFDKSQKVITEKCHLLKQKGCHSNLIKTLVDIVKELVTRMKILFHRPDNLKTSSNSLDHWAVNQVQSLVPCVSLKP